MYNDELTDNFTFESDMPKTEIIPIIETDDRQDEIEIREGDVLPLLPLRNMVLFPGVMLPIAVARPSSLKLVRAMFKQEKPIGVCTQMDKHVEDPDINDLYHMGVAARILRIFEMPDNSVTVILEGLNAVCDKRNGEPTPVSEGQRTAHSRNQPRA